MLGALVLVMASVTLAAEWWSSVQRAQIVHCQARVNREFLEVLRQRSRLAEMERTSLSRLVRGVARSEARPEPEEATRDALRRFLRRQAALDREQRAATYPRLPTDLCGGGG